MQKKRLINKTSETLSYLWDAKEHVFLPGVSVELDEPIAKHFLYHLGRVGLNAIVENEEIFTSETSNTTAEIKKSDLKEKRRIYDKKRRTRAKI